MSSAAPEAHGDASTAGPSVADAPVQPRFRDAPAWIRGSVVVAVLCALGVLGLMIGSFLGAQTCESVITTKEEPAEDDEASPTSAARSPRPTSSPSSSPASTSTPASVSSPTPTAGGSAGTSEPDPDLDVVERTEVLTCKPVQLLTGLPLALGFGAISFGAIAVLGLWPGDLSLERNGMILRLSRQQKREAAAMSRLTQSIKDSTEAAESRDSET